MASQDARLSKFEADFKQQQSEMTNKIDTVLKAITDRMAAALPSDTVKNLKLNVNSTTPVLYAREFQNGKPKEEEQKEKYNPKNINTNPSSPPDPIKDDSDVMFIEIIKKNNDSRKEEPEVDENAEAGELEKPISTEGCPSNLKIPCNIGHVHVEKAYIDLNSPLNVMTRSLYNWIMRRKLDPRCDPNGRVSNFTRRIKGMHIFVGNFTYQNFPKIVEDISSIIDPRLSQVVLGKPFVEISNMTHDPSEGVVRFTNGTDEIAYKMTHKIEQYNSLSDLEKNIQNLSTLGTRRIREEG
ncbi:hypothetical protein Tco_0117622 [Tanacetum coccineum]